MEDVLDEWKTVILKSERDREESLNLKKKVCPFFSCFPSYRGVVKDHDFAIKIKKINEELDVIAREKDMYQLAISSEIRQPRRQESTSFVDVSTIHGRDEVKNKIVRTLLCGNDIDIQTISIVGMGGIGKTALAQLIFHDDKVRAHFQNTGMSGSKILVTTRKKSVARVMESLDFDLEQLSHEVCWSIIKQLAFRGKNDALCKNLEGVGREITEKCNGLPLVAKTLGSLL
ncbi:hypothetical protein PTKIN_Ptkin08bG0024000 [Pterospermum kingtungense]